MRTCCTEHVLHLFESWPPADPRPREAAGRAECRWQRDRLAGAVSPVVSVALFAVGHVPIAAVEQRSVGEAMAASVAGGPVYGVLRLLVRSVWLGRSTWLFDRCVLPQFHLRRILRRQQRPAAPPAAVDMIAGGVITGTCLVDEEAAMHSPAPSVHATPETDAEIDAAVRVFMAAVTGVHHLVDAVAQRHEDAAETIAGEVTEVLATLALHR